MNEFTIAGTPRVGPKAEVQIASRITRKELVDTVPYTC